MKKTLLIIFALVGFFSIKAQTLVTGQIFPVPVTVAPLQIDLFFTNSSTTITTTVTLDGMGYFTDTSSISGSGYIVTASFVDCHGNTVTYTANYIAPSPATTGHYDFGVLDWCPNTLPNSSTVVGQFTNTTGVTSINVSYDGGITYLTLNTDSNGYLYDSQMVLTGQGSIMAYFYDCNSDTVFLTALNISNTPNNEYYNFGFIDFCPGSASGSYINITGQMNPNPGIIPYTIAFNNTILTGMTDSSGVVSLDSVAVSSQPNFIIITFTDCNGNTAMDTAFPPTILPYPTPYSFGTINYCPNIVNPPVGCLAGFTINQNVIIDSFGNVISTSNIFISNNSQGQNLTYTWDFGDGSPTYTGVHFLHTYATAGPYVLCLTVSSPATAISPACSDTYCDSLMVNANGVITGKTNGGFTIEMGDGSDVSETPTSINTIDGTISALNIYPNPANDFINISFESENKEDVILNLFDLTGNLVQVADLKGNTENKVELNKLNKGIYLVQLKTAKGVITKKLSIK